MRIWILTDISYSRTGDHSIISFELSNRHRHGHTEQQQQHFMLHKILI
jgi:hypothetical protein